MEACICQLCEAYLGNVSELMRHILLHLGQEPHSANLKKNFSEYISESGAPQHVGIKQHSLKSTGQKSFYETIFNEKRKKMSHHAGEKRRNRMYTNDSLNEALALIKEHRLSQNKASKLYNIPRTTLNDHLHGKYDNRTVQGTGTVLSVSEESKLAEWVIYMTKIGFDRTRQELVSTVQKILKEDGRPNPFTDDKPGRYWYRSFLRRHPNILPKPPPNILAKPPLQLAEWFENLKEYITVDIEQPDILKDPTRIYSADESRFPLSSENGKVFVQQGSGVMYSSTTKENPQITVLACTSASGHYMSPLIVYPRQRFVYNPLEGFEEACMGRSENGWMDSELFASWLEDIFVPGIEQQRVQHPVLLLVDGHSTHLTIHASNICQANGIELYCLPEHAPHFKLFSSLKDTWRQSVKDYQKVNIGDYVTEITFASVFKQAWDMSATTEEAIIGFRNAGLFPFDPSVHLSTNHVVPTEVIYHACPQQPHLLPQLHHPLP